MRRIKRRNNNINRASGPWYPLSVTKITRAVRSDNVVHLRIYVEELPGVSQNMKDYSKTEGRQKCILHEN
jgi:hypothetical protein